MLISHQGSKLVINGDGQLSLVFFTSLQIFLRRIHNKDSHSTATKKSINELNNQKENRKKRIHNKKSENLSYNGLTSSFFLLYMETFT